ncbi:MAG: SusC/RagA family TonB-linked outer membrane protein [Bacteroidota bacterium]
MQVSAATFGQRITMNQKNASLSVVLKEIRKQSGYDFFYDFNKVPRSQKVSVNVNNASLDETLVSVFKGLDFEYAIEGKIVTIKQKASLIESVKERVSSFFQRDSTVYFGKVLDEKGLPLPGATIYLKGATKGSVSTTNGDFARFGTSKSIMVIKYVGYQTKEISLAGLDPKNEIIIKMIPGANDLGEVSIVSTGYQDLPKERATGSFEVITKEQLLHSTDPNLIKRLEGITTSMNFNNNLIQINSANSGAASIQGRYLKSPLVNLTIRGKNTLQPTTDPSNITGQVLVVIDGIASPYSIDNINPNDVENITVLKDAAAASIWGSRAANGVIVVKTKRGQYNSKVNISLNSNFNTSKKLDLFYRKVMSTSDYIDAQIFRFKMSNNSIGDPDLSSAQAANTPVDEILNQQKSGLIDQAQAEMQLNALRGNDIRKDFEKYMLRDQFTQSYSLGIDGGSKSVTYRLSGGYDRTKNNTVASGGDRLVLTYNGSFRPLKFVEFNTIVSYSELNTANQAQEGSVSSEVGTPFYPYTRLVDNDGNPTTIPYQYRPQFLDLLEDTYGSKILNLRYNPLENIKEGYTNTNSKNLNFNVGTKITINPIFSVDLLYNFSTGRSTQDLLYGQNSFYMRDLVNLFTAPPGSIDYNTGEDISFRRQIPIGDYYNSTISSSNNHTARGQFSANKTWNDRHTLNVIGGVDINQSYTINQSNGYYGYNEKKQFVNNQLDYYNMLNTLYIGLLGAFQMRIPGTISNFYDYKIRTYSLFSNGSYTYDGRYTISGSVRKDASSEFGVGTNKSGTPFYSIGSGWSISNEDFYKLSWLPRLHLTATFGYNGNVNPYVIPRPVITYSEEAGTNQQFYATTTNRNATNSTLRPERTAFLKLGLDFGFKNGRINGNVEYYDKKTTDLIADNSLDPTTGFSSLAYNTATLRGRGVDINLNSQNVQSGLFKWSSNFLISYNRVMVTKLNSKAPKTAEQLIYGAPNYSEGYDLSRLFAFRWAGLDPQSGNPRGYGANGELVTITNSIAPVASLPESTARYFGSAVPVYYGSVRNTLHYGSFSISANVLYKFGYYFRRPISNIVRYYPLFNGSQAPQSTEYALRWQKPGDELSTNVPSLFYARNTQRDNFYQYSEINVLKADHLRLQEINLSYSLRKITKAIKNSRVYFNVSNLGVLWRANKLGIDPDVADYPNPRTYAFGFSTNF